MPKLDDAKSLADLYFDEIDATIEIRQSYTKIVVGMAGSLIGSPTLDDGAKGIIKQALKHKAADTSALYKPLIVQVNGVFEHYIRSLTKAIVEDRFETLERYTDLDRDFRKDYITYAARVLTHLKTGSVMGAAYNFDDLLENLGKGLSGQKGYKLNPEIYTKLMGNCTAERLKKLFSALNLGDPFSDKLGENAQLRKYFADQTKRRVANRALEKLNEQINLRNDIVHGDLTRTIALEELIDALGFFRAFISGLNQLVQT
jgi:hypothetical protein